MWPSKIPMAIEGESWNRWLVQGNGYGLKGYVDAHTELQPVELQHDPCCCGPVRNAFGILPAQMLQLGEQLVDPAQPFGIDGLAGMALVELFGETRQRDVVVLQGIQRVFHAIDVAEIDACRRVSAGRVDRVCAIRSSILRPVWPRAVASALRRLR